MTPPAARLEVVAGNAAGTSIVVDDEIVIGRHADGAGRLADDEEISRTHARVTVDGSGVCEIEDLGSTNGTYVNGLRISQPQALSVGDMIELGQTTLAVRELPAPPRRSSSELFFPEEEFDEEFEDERDEAVEPEVSPSAPTSMLEAPASPTEEPAPGAAAPDIPKPYAAPGPAEPKAEPEPAPLSTSAAPASFAPAVTAGPDPGDRESEDAAQTPPLNLQLQVDFVRREALVSLDRDSEPVRFIFEAGTWQVARSAPADDGH